MANGQDIIAEFILTNLSVRMSDAIREEIEEAGVVKPKIGEAAMAEIITAIRKQVAAGEIQLILPDNESD
jgi:flagellar motor switch protein FliG